MHQSSSLDLGLDVHQDAIAVAYVATAQDAAGVDLGTIGTRPCDLDQRSRTLPAKAPHLGLVDAAGPCGDWRERERTHQGDDCWVVAPSLLPHKAGDRGNPDRSAAGPWARRARSGARTPVDGPTVDEEASRDRPRAREETLSALQDPTCRLNACLRRHTSRSPGRATGPPAHRRGLAAVGCPTPAQPIGLHADVRTMTAHTARLQRLAQARHEPVNAWRLPPVGDALQAWRGVPCTGAVTMGAERGDRTRCDHPRERLHGLGLLPSASATGARRRQGSRTKAGPTQARRALGEGAWADRAPATVSRPRQRSLAQPPKALQDIR